ncbi:hypothetical protein JYT75_01120 [Oceanicaulis sp. AH-315-P02]|nr:hypothetical protein [Robiginitomaculum sp.]MBN4047900.1 hypothetical protein [Oceanicaulis sp. AH-315-P02]
MNKVTSKLSKLQASQPHFFEAQRAAGFMKYPHKDLKNMEAYYNNGGHLCALERALEICLMLLPNNDTQIELNKPLETIFQIPTWVLKASIENLKTLLNNSLFLDKGIDESNTAHKTTLERITEYYEFLCVLQSQLNKTTTSGVLLSEKHLKQALRAITTRIDNGKLFKIGPGQQGNEMAALKGMARRYVKYLAVVYCSSTSGEGKYSEATELLSGSMLYQGTESFKQAFYTVLNSLDKPESAYRFFPMTTKRMITLFSHDKTVKEEET